MNYFFSYCYFYCLAKIFISPLTFVGSAIEKNEYLPCDKFTANEFGKRYKKVPAKMSVMVKIYIYNLLDLISFVLVMR